MASVLVACGSDDSGSTATAHPSSGQGKPGRPNIILLLFDDAGYSDMSAFGGEIQTPNIERIVREGISVSRFYTTARCSPTRAGILTGNHPHDVGMADLAGPQFKTEFSAYQGRLPQGIPLVSELLQAAGYRTYMQGKWHLGDVAGPASKAESGAAPNLRGFDQFFGYLGQQAPAFPNPFTHPYKHNQQAMALDEGWFSITGLNAAMMAELSLQFQRDADSPFFLYIASQSPHYPLGAPEALIEKYRKVYSQPLQDIWKSRVSRMRELGLFPQNAPTIDPAFTAAQAEEIRAMVAIRAAMIEATDTEFGKLLKLLEDSGKLDNTLIIVTSDNGAAAEASKLTNAPYRGAKGNLYEGGVLSPLAARWPAGNIEGNTITNDMTTYLDLMPTFLSVAQVTYPAKWHGGTPLERLAGRDLLPLFRGEKLPPPENFYWNLYGQSAVLHEGRWKLLANTAYSEERERNQAEPELELYDLLSDPAETANVASEQKATVSLLQTNYKAWAQQHGAVPNYQVLDAYRKNRANPQPGSQAH